MYKCMYCGVVFKAYSRAHIFCGHCPQREISDFGPEHKILITIKMLFNKVNQ